MKKWLISCNLLIIFALLSSVFIVPSSKVEAASNHIVYYQAIHSTDSTGSEVASITAVSQYYYKDSTNINSKEAYTITGYRNLNDDNLSDLFCGNDHMIDWSDPGYPIICGGAQNTISATLASLTISKNGDVEIELANDVKLKQVHIYYILANQNPDNDSRLFCSGNKICKNAEEITKEGTNWLNSTKTGKMSYSGSDIADDFTEYNLASGSRMAKRYGNFNIFNKMSLAYRSIADKSQIFALTCLAIDYTPAGSGTTYTYYVNFDMIDNGKFTGIGTTKNAKTENAYVVANLTSGNRGDNIITSASITARAALLTSPSNSDLSNKDAYNTANDYFTKNIRPIIIIIVGVMFLVTGTSTIIQIAKSSDEPEQRSLLIKRLIAMVIGAFVIMAILIFYEPIINAFQKYFG